MNISRPFILRPVATALLAFAVLLAGIVAYFSLPVASLPAVDFPTLQISTSLPGGSPTTMASNVATPLERQFSLIPGVTQMTSSSSLGSTSITLQFALSQSVEYDFQQVQAAVNAASAQLPSNLPAQPTIRQVNPADTPIMVLSLTSKTLPIDTVDNFADTIFSQRMSSIEGVGQVTIGGQQKPAVRIEIDPRKAAARGLDVNTIRTKITAQTLNSPKGSINGGQQTLTIYANDQILDAKGWRDLVVGYNQGAAVHLSDIGSVSDGVENNQIGAWIFPGKADPDKEVQAGQGILLVVFKQPGANVIDTVDRINQALPSMEANIPPGIHVSVLRDGTQTIRASVADVQNTMLLTIVLVVGVIFVFLLDWRATIIPSTIIPLALLGAAGALLFLGDSLDNLSLMALSIAVGFVVDDAIVMVEVIWQKMEHGARPLEAALAGAGEVGFTLLSITVSLIAVFTPLMFMGGVVGLLMHEFAVALSAAVLVSMLLTLTVTPMLCGQFLKQPKPPQHRFTRAMDNGFKRMEASYERGLTWVMDHRLLTLIGFLLTIVLAGVLYATASTGFFPEEDTGLLGGLMQTAQSSTFPQTKAKAQEVGRIIASDPAVSAVGMFVGNGSGNQANMFIALKPMSEGRKITAPEIIARLRPKLAKVIGARTILQARQDINMGGRSGQAEYQYTLADADMDELNTWSPKMLAAMQKLPELRDVNSDQQSQGASLNLDIDRAAAARFGLTPTDVDDAVYEMLGQDEIAQFYTQQNSYHVVMEAPPKLQETPDILNSMFVLSSTTGKTVPLSLFVKATPSGGTPVSVNHQGEFPAVTLSFNLAPVSRSVRRRRRSRTCAIRWARPIRCPVPSRAMRRRSSSPCPASRC